MYSKNRIGHKGVRQYKTLMTIMHHHHHMQYERSISEPNLITHWESESLDRDNIATDTSTTAAIATESTSLLLHNSSPLPTYSGTQERGQGSSSDRPDEEAQPLPDLHEEEDVNMEPETEENEEDDVTFFYRLHVTLYLLCMPAIPMMSMLLILSLELVWNAAFSPACSYPLRFFSFVSISLFTYTPYHHYFKKRLLNRPDREWDVTYAIIPLTSSAPTVLTVIYDQLFYVVCFMYVYFDIVLFEGCKEDVFEGISSCATTCPELYGWFEKFHAALMALLSIVIFPLVCLAFIYLWVLKRVITSNSLWTINGRLREPTRSQGGQAEDFAGKRSMVTVKEIMDGLRDVRLVEIEGTNKVACIGEAASNSCHDKVIWDRDRVKDCCVCLSEFEYSDSSIPSTDVNGKESSHWQDSIVETRCGHFFHKACIGGWIGGADWEDGISMTSEHCYARRQCCPLCRENLTVKYTRP